MKKTDVAILGTGAMGRTVISHLKHSDHVNRIVGYDIDDNARTLAQEKCQIQTTDDLNVILNNTDIKVAFVTASNAAHCDLTVAALRAGKAVMCEKPIAATIEDSKRVVEEAERLGAFLQIGFELRYSLLYKQVKDWIDQGLLGKVVNTHCKYICSEFHHKGSWRNRLSTCGGMFGEKLSHYVDLPRWWIDQPVKDVYTACAPNTVPYYEVRDNYHCVYRFQNGAVSALTFVMHLGETFDGDPLGDHLDRQKDDGHELRYLITGTKGAVETDVFRRTIKRWEFGDSDECMTSKIVERLTWEQKDDHRYFHNTLDQSLDIVRRVVEGLPPMTPARDALQTMHLVDAAEQSANEQRIVELPVPQTALQND